MMAMGSSSGFLRGCCRPAGCPRKALQRRSAVAHVLVRPSYVGTLLPSARAPGTPCRHWSRSIRASASGTAVSTAPPPDGSTPKGKEALAPGFQQEVERLLLPAAYALILTRVLDGKGILLAGYFIARYVLPLGLIFKGFQRTEKTLTRLGAFSLAAATSLGYLVHTAKLWPGRPYLLLNMDYSQLVNMVVPVPAAVASWIMRHQRLGNHIRFAIQLGAPVLLMALVVSVVFKLEAWAKSGGARKASAALAGTKEGTGAEQGTVVQAPASRTIPADKAEPDNKDQPAPASDVAVELEAEVDSHDEETEAEVELAEAWWPASLSNIAVLEPGEPVPNHWHLANREEAILHRVLDAILGSASDSPFKLADCYLSPGPATKGLLCFSYSLRGSWVEGQLRRLICRDDIGMVAPEHEWPSFDRDHRDHMWQEEAAKEAPTADALLYSQAQLEAAIAKAAATWRKDMEAQVADMRAELTEELSKQMHDDMGDRAAKEGTHASTQTSTGEDLKHTLRALHADDLLNKALAAFDNAIKMDFCMASAAPSLKAMQAVLATMREVQLPLAQGDDSVTLDESRNAVGQSAAVSQTQRQELMQRLDELDKYDPEYLSEVFAVQREAEAWRYALRLMRNRLADLEQADQQAASAADRADRPALAQLAEEVATLKSQLDALQQQRAGDRAQQGMDSPADGQPDLEKLEARIASLEEDLGGLADAEDVNDLESRVDQLELSATPMVEVERDILCYDSDGEEVRQVWKEPAARHDVSDEVDELDTRVQVLEETMPDGDELYSRMSVLEDSVSGIAHLVSRVAALEKGEAPDSAAELASAEHSLWNSLPVLQKRVADLEGRLPERSEMTHMQVQLNELERCRDKPASSDLDSRMSELESSLSDLADLAPRVAELEVADLDGLEERVSELEQQDCDINDLEARVSDLEEEDADLEGLEERVAELEEHDIDDLAERLSKVEEHDFEGLMDRIAELEDSDWDGIEQRLTEKENEDFEGLYFRVQDMEKEWVKPDEFAELKRRFQWLDDEVREAPDWTESVIQLKDRVANIEGTLVKTLERRMRDLTSRLKLLEHSARSVAVEWLDEDGELVTEPNKVLELLREAKAEARSVVAPLAKRLEHLENAGRDLVGRVDLLEGATDEESSESEAEAESDSESETDAESDASDSEEDIEDLQEQIDHLQDQLRTASQGRNSLHERLTSLETAHAKAVRGLEDNIVKLEVNMDGTLATAEHISERGQRKVYELADEVQALQLSQKALAQDVASVHSTLTDPLGLKSRVDVLMDRVSELEAAGSPAGAAELAALRDELEGSVPSIQATILAAVRGDLEDLRTEHAGLDPDTRAELEALPEQLADVKRRLDVFKDYVCEPIMQKQDEVQQHLLAVKDVPQAVKALDLQLLAGREQVSQQLRSFAIGMKVLQSGMNTEVNRVREQLQSEVTRLSDSISTLEAGGSADMARQLAEMRAELERLTALPGEVSTQAEALAAARKQLDSVASNLDSANDTGLVSRRLDSLNETIMSLIKGHASLGAQLAVVEAKGGQSAAEQAAALKAQLDDLAELRALPGQLAELAAQVADMEAGMGSARSVPGAAGELAVLEERVAELESDISRLQIDDAEEGALSCKEASEWASERVYLDMRGRFSNANAVADEKAVLERAERLHQVARLEELRGRFSATPFPRALLGLRQAPPYDTEPPWKLVDINDADVDSPPWADEDNSESGSQLADEAEDDQPKQPANASEAPLAPLPAMNGSPQDGSAGAATENLPEDEDRSASLWYRHKNGRGAEGGTQPGLVAMKDIDAPLAAPDTGIKFSTIQVLGPMRAQIWDGDDVAAAKEEMISTMTSADVALKEGQPAAAEGPKGAEQAANVTPAAEITAADNKSSAADVNAKRTPVGRNSGKASGGAKLANDLAAGAPSKDSFEVAVEVEGSAAGPADAVAAPLKGFDQSASAARQNPQPSTQVTSREGQVATPLKPSPTSSLGSAVDAPSSPQQGRDAAQQAMAAGASSSAVGGISKAAAAPRASRPDFFEVPIELDSDDEWDDDLDEDDE